MAVAAREQIAISPANIEGVFVLRTPDATHDSRLLIHDGSASFYDFEVSQVGEPGKVANNLLALKAGLPAGSIITEEVQLGDGRVQVDVFRRRGN